MTEKKTNTQIRLEEWTMQLQIKHLLYYAFKNISN